MPWTFYRYVLKDLIRLLVMTTGVLVFVMSVSAAVQYISEGLLGPLSLMKFVGYTMPTMLSMALPFAGAFVGTLVFNRMMADNEILICRAGGINYLLILLPVGFLGIALMVAMFYLSNWMIPGFYARAEHTLEKDIVSVVVRKIQNGDYFQYENMVLYADGASEAEPPEMEVEEGIVPQRRVAMKGVAIAQLDATGKLRSDGTAERADMLLYRKDDESRIMLQLKNVRYFGDEANEGRGTMEELPLGPYRIESAFRERLRFLSWPELRRLKKEPEGDRHVRRMKAGLANAMAREQLIREMQASLQKTLTLITSLRGERYEITAPVVQPHDRGLALASKDDKPVEVKMLVNGMLLERTYRAKTAVLAVDADETAEPRVDIRLYDVEVINTRDEGRSTQHPMRPLPLMRSSKDIAAPIRKLSMPKMMSTAEKQYPDVKVISELNTEASYRITRVLREGFAQLHERAALAVGCLLMIVLGAILSMKLEGRTPLVVYFWTFVLATISIIVTRTGVRLVDQTYWTLLAGIIVIWSGNILVCAAILTCYWRLERH